MVDSKSVISQVQELQVIIHDLLAEGLVINEAFQVAAMIEKLPPLWKDFKNYLKHKCKEMSLENLIVRLRIEEDNKAAEREAVETQQQWEQTLLRILLKIRERGSMLLDQKATQARSDSTKIATTVKKLDINLQIVVLRRKSRRRVKKTWLKSTKMLMTCVLCFLNATWWEILRSSGLILEPLAMFVLIGKLLLHMLLLDPKRCFLSMLNILISQLKGIQIL
ncbi:uncharacterized protein LOC107826709 [Nicotiana tabacum]|uniref:Uncharacterized protein LOC107826709 n=1 Tax=Nicotiana tabacum TaxID=4097 RepID=A0AC58S1G2_TOBAC